MVFHGLAAAMRTIRLELAEHPDLHLPDAAMPHRFCRASGGYFARCSRRRLDPELTLLSADKRCQEGGKWDWKIGGPTVLIDYASSGGHIHLSLKAETQRDQEAR